MLNAILYKLKGTYSQKDTHKTVRTKTIRVRIKGPFILRSFFGPTRRIMVCVPNLSCWLTLKITIYKVRARVTRINFTGDVPKIEREPTEWYTQNWTHQKAAHKMVHTKRYAQQIYARKKVHAKWYTRKLYTQNGMHENRCTLNDVHAMVRIAFLVINKVPYQLWMCNHCRS